MFQYELNLRDYLRIFRKRKIVIFSTFLVVLIGSIIYVSIPSPVYQAAATIKIEERKTIAGLLTEWIVYTPADIMESQTRIIKGFPIMKKVAMQMGLIDDSFSVSKINNVVAGLQGRIATETIGRTNIIKIAASAGSAKEAMELANAVAQVSVEENLLEKTKQARATRAFIEEQLSQLDNRLRETEELLKKFGDDVKGIRLAEPIHNELVELEFKLAAFLQRYTEEHPQVMQLREQIKNLEAQLAGFSGQELEYARLVREVEVNKKLYNMLKEKLEEARITEAQKVGDISIVDPALCPGSPVGPRKEMVAIIGGILGLILGIGLAFMFETMDTSIGTIEDVERVVQLPILGVIPSISTDEKDKKGIFGYFQKKMSYFNKTESEEIYIRLITHHKPMSSMSEAYRNLRTNLKIGPNRRTFLITSAGPREGKTTVLTNLGLSVAQKGTRVLLISSDLRRPVLAKTFAIKKEPGLNELITGAANIEDAVMNISDIILGDMPIDSILTTPEMGNIWILPSGRLSLNPAEILESPKFLSLLEDLKNRFDVIFLDSPPVLPVTDASLLAPKVDSVILCYEIGRTTREALLRAKVQLESVGGKILGVVLNHIAPQAELMSTYPYYSRYKDRYYMAEEKKESQVKKSKRDSGSGNV